MAGTPTPVIVAHCGLVCSECGAWRHGKCGGCHSDRPLFAKCPVKRCSTDRHQACCAECAEFADLRQCRRLNNWVAKLLGFIFRSHRLDNLVHIRQTGLDAFKAQRAAARPPPTHPE